ncbi:FAM210A/B-like domain containing protein [Lotmaria passim]
MRCVMRTRCLPAVASSSLLFGRSWKSTSTASQAGRGDARHAPTPTTPAGTTAAAVLPGVDLARRAVQPSQEFPATWSEDEPLAPTDPRTAWRELYSLEAEKPYYQNIQTMEVRWEIPEGFVTRFPRLYESSGYYVDEHGAVFRARATVSSAAATAAVTSETASKSSEKTDGVRALTLKQRMAAYGAGGLLWYLIVHSVSFCGVFTCLYFLHIDLIGVARSYGFDVKPSADVVVSEKKRPPFWKTFVVALVLNKMLVPVHLFITVTTAPILVHRLEPIAARLFPAVQSVFRSFFSKTKAASSSAKA